MSSARQRTIRQPFRPRARILQLLGDELIGSARLAVFELVKNAYDADASRVMVRLDLRPEESPTITVADDGTGMTLAVLRNIWLVPGNEHRQKQRLNLTRSPKYKRLPLGEKGLGRFAVHKLGNRIRVTTRAKGEDECIVEIDWAELIAKPYLDEAPITIRVREPQMFTGRKTGTHIEVSELRQDTWTRGEVRRLQRQITSISSPFQHKGEFQAILEVPGREEWISEIADVREILDRALWKFTFHLDRGKFDWTYELRQVPGLKLASRRFTRRGDKLKLPEYTDGSMRGSRKVIADAATTRGIGPVDGEFYIFDRDREVLKRLPDVALLTNYLDENGGIRIYRDGMRVYNYGEPNDDWLGLDLRRVNTPTRNISRNIIIGSVHLSLEHSTELVEKTNREGFVENDASDRLRALVLGALSNFEAERQIDKDRIRSLTDSGDDPTIQKIQKPIGELRRALGKKGLADTFEPYLAKIEHDYTEMQETLLAAGMSGLNLAVVFHEVERGVRALHQVIVDGVDPGAAGKQARDLMHLLDGFSTLLRRDSRSRHSAYKLIEAARTFNALRFRHHNIELVAPLLEKKEPGFEASFAFSLVIGALNNLIDNSIYWLRVRWPEVDGTATTPRRIYIGSSEEFEAGPALVIADTGTGLQDDPDRIVRPFFTRRPNGMGLGMYYANLAMELSGGRLAFPQRDEVSLPSGFDGAVVALIFRRAT